MTKSSILLSLLGCAQTCLINHPLFIFQDQSHLLMINTTDIPLTYTCPIISKLTILVWTVTSDLGWCKITCLEKVKLKGEKNLHQQKKRRNNAHINIMGIRKQTRNTTSLVYFDLLT